MDAIVEDWLAAQLSPATSRTYGYGIREFRGWAERSDADVLTATRGDIDRYRTWLTSAGRPGGPIATATLAVRLSILASFYKYVMEEYPSRIDRSPMDRVRRPRVSPESQREGLSLVQARALLAASIAYKPRDAALVHVLLMTAVRVSEACGATTADLRIVDGERRLQVVRKGGTPDEVLLPARCWELLKRYLDGRPAGPEGPLLMTSHGGAMSRQTAYRVVARLARGVAPGQRIGPHSLRHTAATLALDDGRPLQEVQQMLGHSSPQMTMRYDRARSGRGRAAGRALGALLDVHAGVPPT